MHDDGAALGKAALARWFSISAITNFGNSGNLPALPLAAN